MSGIATDTETVRAPDLEAMACAINSALRFRGAWFFQVKRDITGAPVLLEVAPRIAGSSGLWRALNVNLPLLTVYDRMGLTVAVEPLHLPARMDRALAARYSLGIVYRHVYIDLDDTLLINGKVNLQAVAFLYQCFNHGISLHLVTRRRAYVREDLERLGLGRLFDRVITVPETEQKAAYIGEREAIFIDDSFQEREAVRRVVGIPVFSTDALGALLEGTPPWGL